MSTAELELTLRALELERDNKLDEAVVAAKSLQVQLQSKLPADHVKVVEIHYLLGRLHWKLGRYAMADSHLEHALKRCDLTRDKKTDLCVKGLHILGLVRHEQGRLTEAIKLGNHLISKLDKTSAADQAYLSRAYDSLGVAYLRLRRIDDAESYVRLSLDIKDKILPESHPAVSQSLGYLAEIYASRGRVAEAFELMTRVVERMRAHDHPELADSLRSFGKLGLEVGNLAVAEKAYREAIATSKRRFRGAHGDIALGLEGLAAVLWSQGRRDESFELYAEALEIRRLLLPDNKAAYVNALSSAGFLWQTGGSFEIARSFYKKALELLDEIGESSESLKIDVLANDASILEIEGKHVDAYRRYRRMGELLRKSENSHGAAISESDRATGSVRVNSFASGVGLFRALARAAYRVRSNPEFAREAAELGFDAAQQVNFSSAAASIERLAMRNALGRDLSQLIRERQDAVAARQQDDQALIRLWSSSASDLRSPSAVSLRANIAELTSRIDAIDTEIGRRFPDFSSVLSSRPLSITEIRSLLGPKEALVVMLDAWQIGPLPEESLLWVVTRSEVRWFSSKPGTSALKQEVSALRCGLDLEAWADASAKGCSDMLGIAHDKSPKQSNELPFNTARAHSLYKALFGQAEDLIKDKHLLLVPSGPATQLPFQVLVTKPPASPDLNSAAWLIRDNAITVLPSVASLSALRRVGKPSVAARPMLGFANPLLDGNQKHTVYGDWYRQQATIARTQSGCATVSPQRTAALRSVSRSVLPVPQSAGLADLAHLRLQSPLPETADEVCQVARSVGADVSEMRIGARATEKEIKALSASGELAKYRILHFATHGTLAGQLSGTSEPGLILTPPATAAPEDDGYLSGSEIAALKLDADWVILSACNTAGGAGKGEAAEALSGLARMFFYAGARALLVSHWAVDSAATVKLITSAVGAMTKDPSIGRAEALRRAMLTVMADTSRPANWVPAWHPSVWAPFVVVGEGGAGR